MCREGIPNHGVGKLGTLRCVAFMGFENEFGMIEKHNKHEQVFSVLITTYKKFLLHQCDHNFQIRVKHEILKNHAKMTQ